MVRFYTPNLDEACDALDLYDIDYDLDDGDRIMVDDSLYDDALDAFDEYDIEYEEQGNSVSIRKKMVMKVNSKLFQKVEELH